MNMFTLAALLLFVAGGVNTQVLEPTNAVVLQSTSAKFNCSVSSPRWVVMTWSLNKHLEVTILENGNIPVHSDRFSVTNYSTEGVSKYEFVIKNATRADSEVTCQLQGGVQASASLTVQETGSMAIVGSNRTAVEGTRVTFQCLAAGWFPAAELSWALNGTAVDKSLYNNTSAQNGTGFNCESTFNHTASNNFSVECLASIPALTAPERRTVFLTVYKPKQREYTVLLAIVLGFGLAGLLAFFIILFFICCKKRKRQKSGYEEEARAYSQRENARRGPGYDNQGYTADRRKDDGIFAISGFKLPSHSSRNKQTDMVDYNQRRLEPNYPDRDLGSYDGSYDGQHRRKHRHATIV